MSQRLSTDEMLSAALERGRVATKTLLNAEGGCLSIEEVSNMLGISYAEVLTEVENHRLICVNFDGEFNFPKCQFVDGDLLNGLQQFVAGMASHGPVVTLSFLVSPSPRLNRNARPIDMLRKGKVFEVLDAVKRYGEHGG